MVTRARVDGKEVRLGEVVMVVELNAREVAVEKVRRRQPERQDSSMGTSAKSRHFHIRLLVFIF